MNILILPKLREDPIRAVLQAIAATAAIVFGLRLTATFVANALDWQPAVAELLGCSSTLIGAWLLYSKELKTATTLQARPTSSRPGLIIFATVIFASLSLLAIQVALINSWATVKWAPLLTSHELWQVLSYLICYAVVSPIFEEILFRGYLQLRASQVLATPWTIILPSVCFGLFHWSSIYAVLFAIAFSILLGSFRAYGGSLLQCCIIHCIHNSIVYTDKYFFGYFIRS